MNNRINDIVTITGTMKRIDLPPVTIHTLTFYAPLLKKESKVVVENIENLADMFELKHNGACHTGDVMCMGRLKSRWIIIVKGDENAVDSFERESRKLGT